MAPSPSFTYDFGVILDGSPLSRAEDDLLMSITVDNSFNLPDVAVVELSDPHAALLGSGRFRVGATLEVRVVPAAGPAKRVFVGEVTALEADFDALGARTVLRAYDRSSRLLRGRKTKSWLWMTYSDIISSIATSAGVPVGQLDSTSPVHPQVSQANVEDWHFIRHLADQVGYTVSVLDGKLDLLKPSPVTPGTPAGLDSTDPLSYYPGDTGVVRLRAVVTSAAQVPSTTARSWRPKTKMALVGSSSPAEATNAGAVEDSSLGPSQLASRFSAKPFAATWSAFQQGASVDALAKAASDQIAAASAEIEAEVVGNPDLRPGVVVGLGGVGKLSGSYKLSSTRHLWDRHLGYRTELGVSDRQDRSLLGMVAGGVGAEGALVRTMPSVASAIVTDINDTTDGMCQVKVKFPWLADDYESYWARTVQLGAGSARGFQVLPEVGDEVLVAFEQGDFGAPVVLGGLHNGVDKPPMTTSEAVQDGKVVKRMFRSRTGHVLCYEETDSASKISLISKDQKTELILDAIENRATLQAGKDILVTSEAGQVTITGPKGVTVKSDADITVQAGANIAVKAGADISMEAAGQFSIKGAVVQVQGEGPVQIQGAIVKIN